MKLAENRLQRSHAHGRRQPTRSRFFPNYPKSSGVVLVRGDTGPGVKEFVNHISPATKARSAGEQQRRETTLPRSPAATARPPTQRRYVLNRPHD